MSFFEGTCVDMTQTWNPSMYAEHASFVSELGTPVIKLLAPRPGERILDVGCGDGSLTKKLVDLGCEVIGVDTSPDMVAAARKRGLNVQVMDGAALAFDNEFDAVFSNAALHWMTRPDDVLAGVRKALKPGGRFVGELGGKGNVATVLRALRMSLGNRGIEIDDINPWYFPSAEEYRTRLEAQSFTVHECMLIPRPTRIPSDIVGWLQTFGRSFIDLVPGPERASLLQEVAEQCRAELADRDGKWTVDYVRLRFAATKPK